MKKILLLLFFPVSLFCQSDFNWGISVFPHLAGTRLISFGLLSEEEIAEINEREITRFGYAGGLFAQWKGEKLGFQVGLNFMDTGYRTVKEPIPADDPNPQGATDRRLLYQYQYIELPVEVLFYQNFRNKHAFFFMLGASASYNINNYETTILDLGDSQSRSREKLPQEDFNSFNYAFQAGVGYETELSEKVGLFFEPVFQFWLKEVFKDMELNRSLYTVGLKVGVRFRGGRE